MSADPGPPKASVWLWVWFIALLLNLTTAVGIALFKSGRGPELADLDKAATLMVAAIPLDILLAIGMGIWLARTRGWRSDDPTTTTLLAVILFLLGTAAAVALVFFTCLGAVRI